MMLVAQVKTLGCHPNWPQGAPVAAPLENPGLFNCALPLVGYVSVNTVTGAKACRCAVPSLGLRDFGLETLTQQDFERAYLLCINTSGFSGFITFIIFLLNVTSM
ncbi:hypothetical protein [Rahnella laticis]|uniref:hypothetical protein n=1 Tax=Rahnella laticis TaxID=2787622 RepID=UPI0018A30743|nr:hypothetical protein [Rahnella laticis]MBF7996149.1 hypothetical protein [Rahnella laticis]